MASEKHRRLMQESLDQILPEEAQRELFAYLNEDQDSVAEYNRLNRVHQLLENAPHERAPRRLAATIMARLAQGLEMQVSLEADTQADTRTEHELLVSREMIALALNLVTVSTMPLMIAASWMVIHAQADPAMLTQVLQQIVALTLLVLKIIEVFLQEAEKLAESEPETALAILSLLPITMLAIVRYLLSEQTSQQTQQNQQMQREAVDRENENTVI
jgi:NADH:ubiquinone oxidoreductase subunit 6 (subunit J)